MLLSVVVLTRNSAKTLDNCLTSAKQLQPEIIVVDDGSTDGTLSIAQSHRAKIFKHKLVSFGAQKQFALEQAGGAWALVLDSDEQLDAALADEITRTLKKPGSTSAFRVPRRNRYFGQWLKHGGKYPDYQTRLLKRSECKFSDDIVHEKIVCSGNVGTLINPLDHDTYPDPETYFEKLALFARFRGELLLKNGTRPSFVNAVRFCLLRPAWRFKRRYIFKAGFLDGLPGFLACVHDALTEIFGYFCLTRLALK